MSQIRLRQITPYQYEIPSDNDKRMNVPGMVFASQRIMSRLEQDQALAQVVNVAMLPGIVGASYAMPDIHWGYGFPIGGVAAFDWQDGIVSPGGVGYDINCGVTLIRTDLQLKDVKPALHRLVDEIFRSVPSGVGSTSMSMSAADMDSILGSGLKWAEERGYATKDDLQRTEEYGSMPGADSRTVSDEARKRGMKQIGTLGAGNHFLEIQSVNRIIDRDVADKFGITGEDQVAVMIHTGSRGLGHQVATDYIRVLNEARAGTVVHPVDRQLTSARLGSEIADRYLGAMNAAANFGFVNRQMIVFRVREAFARIFPGADLDMVYSLAHNIAKVEIHSVNGENRKLMVHRKGATRAQGPGNINARGIFRETGHPVLVPGDMGSASYLMVGRAESEDLSFSSSCHGAGRLLSRSKSLKEFNSSSVEQSLGSRGIYLRAQSKRVISEEAPGSYKDIDEVVSSVNGANLARPIARLVPVGVVKG